MDTILSSETVNYKFCPQCQTSKPEKKFKHNQDWCRQCIKEAQKQVPEGMKFCLFCKETKDIELFKIDTRLPEGHKSICKKCHNAEAGRKRDYKTLPPRTRKRYNLKHIYSITIEEYEWKRESQGNVCAACGYPESRLNVLGSIKSLVVDHSHKTGEIRGLLCHDCNIALGFLKDDPARIEGLLKYILKYATMQ